MPKPLLAIVDEHKYVSRLLPLLEKGAEKLLNDERPDFDCMEDIMHYMVNYPDRYHHPKEDLIFGRMSGLAPKTAEAVARLRKDHEKMAAQGQALLDRITAQKRSRSGIKARELAEEITLYTSGLRNHMKLEETEVLQPARTTLTAADWQDIDEAIKPINDPLFGGRIADRYVDLLQRYINEFVSVSSSGPLPVQRLESAVSTIERSIYTIAEMRHLPGQMLKTKGEIIKYRLKHLGKLSEVRDWSTMQAWLQDARTASADDWQRILDKLKEELESAGLSPDTEGLHSDVSTITLHTEKEIRSYREKPYQPSENPRISWQAGLMNVVMRMTLKPMMRHSNLSRNTKSERLSKPSDFVPPDTRIEAVNQTGFHAVWIVPEDPPATPRTILHLPGGGFFAPASAGHLRMLGTLACKTRSRGMLVNYRLLPEHPFPAGLEDALAAYRHLLDDGVQPEEIVLSGDSAGGCLALALMLAARDEGLPMPAACALISPLTDLTFSTAARQLNRWKDPLLPSVRKMGAYEQYAGGAPADHPLVSPIYGSFEGFPPMFALVSSTETLLDDTLVVARKARAQGVDFDVEIWENLPHDWPLFSFLPEAGQALEHLQDFFLRHWDQARESPSGRKFIRAS